jgi:hypothetical protein
MQTGADRIGRCCCACSAAKNPTASLLLLAAAHPAACSRHSSYTAAVPSLLMLQELPSRSLHSMLEGQQGRTPGALPGASLCNASWVQLLC